MCIWSGSEFLKLFIRFQSGECEPEQVEVFVTCDGEMLENSWLVHPNSPQIR